MITAGTFKKARPLITVAVQPGGRLAGIQGFLERHRQFVAAAAAALVVIAVLAAFGVSRLSSKGPFPPRKPNVSTAGIKPHITGILFEGGLPKVDNGYGGYVAPMRWADFEASPGHYAIPAGTQSVIDAAAAAGKGVKIRFFAGIHAPAWLIQEVGTFTYTEGQSKKDYTMPKFWDPRFNAAYAASQVAMAGFLDGNPTVREVTIAAGTTVYDEPLQSIGPLALPQDHAAGMTDAAFLTTVESGIDAMKVWHHTSTYMAFNPRNITAQVMQYFRTSLGPLGVVGNNSIRETTDPASAFYASITALGPPIAFQTAGSTRVGDVKKTLDLAVQMHAEAVEVGAATATALTASDFSHYNGLLAANAASVG
jgi:hypothetical protein